MFYLRSAPRKFESVIPYQYSRALVAEITESRHILKVSCVPSLLFLRSFISSGWALLGTKGISSSFKKWEGWVRDEGWARAARAKLSTKLGLARVNGSVSLEKGWEAVGMSIMYTVSGVKQGAGGWGMSHRC